MTMPPPSQEPPKTMAWHCRTCGQDRPVPNAAWLAWKRRSVQKLQKEIAQLAGVSTSHIQHLECGYRPCTRAIRETYEQL